MPSQPPIPPLLSPNFSALPTSVTLLTSTLGATTNWLVLRFVCAAVKSKGYETGNDINGVREGSYDRRIVLVSWLRDEAWWRESGRKLVSIYHVSVSTNFDIYSTRTGANRHLRVQGIDFLNVDFVDGLGSALGLGAGGIADVERAIMKVVESKKTLNEGRDIVLVLDGLDFLLAATGCEVLGLLDMIGELREVCLLSNYSKVAAWTCSSQISKK